MEQPTRETQTDQPGTGDERPRLDRPTSISSLFSDLMRHTADLVQNETALARAEISQKVSQLESGGVQLLIAAVLGVAAVGALMASAILALSLVLSPWLSALIVGGVIAVIALIFMAVGRSKLKAQNLPPRATTANLRKDADMVREHAR